MCSAIFIWKFTIVFIVFVAISAKAKDDTERFDFIIISGGTSGSALAARLSENKLWRILLLESGNNPESATKIPLNVNRLPRDCKNSHNFIYEKNENYCLAMNGKQCILSMGKGFGGHGMINDMLYSRGNHRDYDDWCRAGNPGWCFKDVLPYFKKLENNTIPGEKIRSCAKDGPMTISYANYKTELSTAFMNAGKEMGYKWVNYNGRQQTGFSLAQTTLKDGLRHTAYEAYLKPVRTRRHNLVIRTNIHFHKLLFNNKKAGKEDLQVIGVQYQVYGFVNTVWVNREVILTSSPINTPRYLMLSGIGPADHLKSLGIEVIKNLPVGYNYHDMIGTGGLIFLSDIPVLDMQSSFTPNSLLEFLKSRKGPVSSPTIEALAFLESSSKVAGHPDFEIAIHAGSLIAQPMVIPKYNLDNLIVNDHFSEILDRQGNAFTIQPSVLRPKSRGRVKLQSSDPSVSPLVEGNFYSDPRDMKTAIKAIKTVLKLMDTKSFKKINARFYDKPFVQCNNYDYARRYDTELDDAYWECFARHFSFPMEQWAGTTKMGPKDDRTAVVDAELRVHGINNLRVCDTSVIPQQISGHTDGVKIMMAEKLADTICKYHNYLDETGRNLDDDYDEQRSALPKTIAEPNVLFT